MIRAHLFCGLILCWLAGSGLWAANQTPNIVFIMADDFGYGSSNCYGADEKFVRTPHINRLATEGLKFTQAYTPGSVCTPTRYAFLTGRYAWRGKLQYGVLSPPDSAMIIEDELLTLPEMLQQHGYRTAHIGKWHLGYTDQRVITDYSAQPLTPGPRSMGFDYHFAVPNNLDWLPKVYVENEGIWGLRSQGMTPYGQTSYRIKRPYHGYDAPQRVTEQVSQDLSDHANKWIADAVANHGDQPFFLFFAPVAVHIPIQPSEKWAGTSGAGAYGDFIHELDHSVGEILRGLEEANILDNTLVIFTSDNGGDFCPEAVEAQEMGFATNGILRGDKHLIWEGGFNVPFLARWPDKLKPGTETDSVVNLVDMHATFQELITGSVLAASEAAADSFSFASTLLGQDSAHERPSMVYKDVDGAMAIRQGDWKYVEGLIIRPPRKGQKKKKDYPISLFNLKDDPSESNNLIEQYPEVAQQMQKLLDEIREAGSERAFHE